jgi:uncharacterized protein YjbI with pentapeptide repeats
MSTRDGEIKSLRERWEGEEARIRKILTSIKREEDWTIHLEGLKLVNQIPAVEGEKYGRDLRGVNFRAENLKEVDLRGANLTGAILYKADLSGADLSATDLAKAVLGYADLSGANLKGAVLKGADLIEADLNRANLIDADLSGAYLSQAGLSHTNLRRAILRDVDLIGANLSDATLYDANLSGAKLGLADLNRAGLIGADLRGANLFRAKLNKANLGRADLSGADLGWTDLSGAGLNDANLKGAKLDSANFENADVSGVKFDRRGRYKGIRVATCYGSQRFKRFAQDQDFIEEFRSIWWRKPIYLLWLILADCGRSLSLWAGWSLAMALIFAGIYFCHIGPDAFYIDPTHPSLPKTFGTFFYYSVVTFTTLGFGDITPVTAQAARWVMAEVILGYIMLGGLISILANKLARRSG